MGNKGISHPKKLFEKNSLLGMVRSEIGPKIGLEFHSQGFGWQNGEGSDLSYLFSPISCMY
jgi:hypothetical protein